MSHTSSERRGGRADAEMRRAGVADTRCSSAAEAGLPGTPAGLDVTPARHMLSDGFQEVLRNPSVS